MEYLNAFEESLTQYPDSEWDFYDLSKLTEYIFGAPLINSDNCNFNKIENINPILLERAEDTRRFLETYNEHTCGVRLRFKTDSDYIVVKSQIKRVWSYSNMNLYNSSGFDLYCENAQGKLQHRTVIAPCEGQQVFAHAASVVPNSNITLYFPNYNKVEKFAIGIKKGNHIERCSDYKIPQPIVIYGNSRTQGASACRSGNAFMNIVSRKLDCDIINYSFSAACKGQKSLANIIAKHEMSAFIMDYNANASSLEDFKQTFQPFYEIIRISHPNIPIILINGYNTDVFNKHVSDVYMEMKQKGEKVFLVNLKELFANKECISFSIDNLHFMDEGMFAIADCIINLLTPIIV